jgi:hypothetical protein
MPLAPTTLSTALEQVFAHPGATHAACAEGWADAMEAYAVGIVPPSTTVVSASAALSSALASAFAQTSGASAMESAFAAFGLSLGGGMAGYLATPPPGPVGFAGLFAGESPKTHPLAATQIGDAIHAWLTTGTSTLVASPNTVVVWS